MQLQLWTSFINMLQFLAKDMPRVHDHLSYRIVDVSTIKELCFRWYPDRAKRVPPKSYAHTALSDIEESIEELRYYKAAVFIAAENNVQTPGAGGIIKQITSSKTQRKKR